MSNDITVKIKADNRQLKTGMDQSSKSVKDFSAEAQRMSVNVAKAGAVVITAVAAIGAGVLKMASEAAKVGVEIKNLSAVAGTSATDFQKMAAASRTVGVEQEKLSDILKDVNDKFGDYMATGAGPLADFFEQIAPKIGVTAKQFANLAGPDALQLYVSSLEKAGVNQQQMTFYMEALASDTTRLLPLLRDGGSEMSRLGDEAARLGLILSQETIDGAVQLDRELAELANTLRVNATKAVVEHKNEIILLVNFITDDLIPAAASLAETLGTVALGWVTIAEEARDAIGPITRALGLSAQMPGATESGNILPPPINPGAGGGGDTSATGTGYVDANGNWVEYGTGESAPIQPGINAPQRPGMTSGSPLDATGGLLPDQDPAAAARAAWEASQELQEEIETGTADHAQRLIDIEERRAAAETRIAEALAQAKKQAMSTMFSDLSSLMGSENDKLFKIGKAAALAEATISGYKAAVDAWEAGMETGGPAAPAVAASYAAASLAKTGMLISKISSTSMGGGGSSSGGGGGGGTASAGGAGGAAQQDVTTFSFTLQNDPMGFGESFARQMIEQLNETQRNGGQIRGVLNT